MAAAAEAHLKCPICLELLSVPVSTPCGHNFCLSCISQQWDLNRTCVCPLCNEIFPLRPVLKTNTLLSEMVSQLTLSSPLSQDTSPVLCDLCPEPQSKAVQSCLVCRVSYCGSHLEPHRTVPRLKKHQLVDPVEDLDNRMCPEHDKLLELFCVTDRSCVCALCPLLQHKDHQLVSLREEFHRERAALQQDQAQTKTQVVQRRLKIQEIQRLVDLSQRAADRETAAGLQAFTALIESVQRSRDRFLEGVQDRLRQVQNRAQHLQEELEQEVSVLKDRMCEMERLSATEEPLLFIQTYCSLKPPALNDWTRVHFETETFGGTASRALCELQDSVGAEFKELFKAQLKKLQQFAVDITLDPDTAHPELVLSEDLKQVYHSNVKRDVPDSALRFSDCPCVLGQQSFSSGKFYFEVQVKGKTDWDLGVARKSINRKRKLKANPRIGYWTITYRNNKDYIACAGPGVPLSLRHRPQKVGVFVNYDERLVCFFDADSAELIYSFTHCSFTEELLPYFGPCKNIRDKNSAPLVLMAHSKSG